MTDNNKEELYYCYITFKETRSGIVQIQASSEEDAKKKITEQLTMVTDLVIDNVSTSVPDIYNLNEQENLIN